MKMQVMNQREKKVLELLADPKVPSLMQIRHIAKKTGMASMRVSNVLRNLQAAGRAKYDAKEKRWSAVDDTE